jgi:uncharacterized protein (TIGR03000 family)
MVKQMMGFFLMVVGTVAPVATASASDADLCGPWAASAAFPTVNPPGWYTNTYSYAWYYPWYAYYNSSHGPYANWMAGRGYASYGYQKPTPPTIPAQVTIILPAEAKLSFSGIVAVGTGAIRSFTTPPLEPNQEYSYEMTATVVKDARTFSTTKLVIVHAGESLEVKFDLAGLKETPKK